MLKIHKINIKRGDKGFTLTEILIGVSIIVVLIAIVILAINPGERLAKARDDQREEHLNIIWNAIEQKIYQDGGEWDCGELPYVPTEENPQIIGSDEGEYDLYSCLYPDFIAEPEYIVDPRTGYFTSINDYYTGYQIWRDSETGDFSLSVGTDGHGEKRLVYVGNPPSPLNLFALGEECFEAFECDSGYCVNAVCCDSACADTCQSCKLAENVGTCQNVPEGYARSTVTGEAVAVSSEHYCDEGDEITDCVDGECTGTITQQYLSCNGTGTCRTAYDSEIDYILEENVYATASYTLTSECGIQGTTLCGYSDYSCDGACQRERNEYRCATNHTCSYTVDKETTYATTAGNVCSDGSWISVTTSSSYCQTFDSCGEACSATRYYEGCAVGSTSCVSDNRASETVYATTAGNVCSDGSWISVTTSSPYCQIDTSSCVNGNCSGTKYYEGCAVGSTSCTNDNRAPETVYADSGYTLTTACGTQGTTICGYSDYFCAGTTGSDACTRLRDKYRCAADHSCSYDTGEDEATYPTENDMVCRNGVFGPLSADWPQEVYCQVLKDCDADVCTGEVWLYGCKAWSADCTDLGTRIDVYAAEGEVLDTECDSQAAGYCDLGEYSCDGLDVERREMFRCDGFGECNYFVDYWTNDCTYPQCCLDPPGYCDNHPLCPT